MVKINRALQHDGHPPLTPPVTLLDANKKSWGFKLMLLNLSAGGTFLSYRCDDERVPRFRAGDHAYFEMDLSHLFKRLDIQLYTSQAALAYLQILSRVVRGQTVSNQQRHFVSLQFLELTEQQKNLLHAVVLKIQQLRASSRLK